MPDTREHLFPGIAIKTVFFSDKYGIKSLTIQKYADMLKKVSNDSWNKFTVSRCKGCPFMVIYRKRDLKLHESVAMGDGACSPVSQS